MSPSQHSQTPVQDPSADDFYFSPEWDDSKPSQTPVQDQSAPDEYYLELKWNDDDQSATFDCKEHSSQTEDSQHPISIPAVEELSKGESTIPDEVVEYA
ncbi:hypothetical protein ACET3X_002544 [Alternaria dauci]|uniref:Uncharacterized protein n=1 Tax=Alternaria dauci TaxID=48095 RepID=A0ABR3UQE6_9PLEO